MRRQYTPWYAVRSTDREHRDGARCRIGAAAPTYRPSINRLSCRESQNTCPISRMRRPPIASQGAGSTHRRRDDGRCPTGRGSVNARGHEPISVLPQRKPRAKASSPQPFPANRLPLKVQPAASGRPAKEHCALGVLRAVYVGAGEIATYRNRLGFEWISETLLRDLTNGFIARPPIIRTSVETESASNRSG